MSWTCGGRRAGLGDQAAGFRTLRPVEPILGNLTLGFHRMALRNQLYSNHFTTFRGDDAPVLATASLLIKRH